MIQPRLWLVDAPSTFHAVLISSISDSYGKLSLVSKAATRTLQAWSFIS